MEPVTIQWEPMRVKTTMSSIGNVEAMRARVPGGWLVMVAYSHAGVTGMLPNPGVTFVPDEGHRWGAETV